MKELRQIDSHFVDEYIFNHRNNLGTPTMGGTDWRFADIVAPAFREVLEIAEPESLLEIGFNAGGAALMFLSIDTDIYYHGVDIQENKKSIDFLKNKFKRVEFTRIDSRFIDPKIFCFKSSYDLISIDGDHSKEGVVNDIEKSLLFNPKYLLFDDYRHPSHSYIEKIVTEDYKEKLDVVKVFEFNQCWQGYSFAICKVIK
ncbi:MAG: hypothetical protein KBA90_13870 [Chitinophagaceae bacterium]|nr:hypothetical protein [Chitinophagaceae bacterium]MBP7109641.1 hypothetical protein [Chitinophagaceae bacterium]